MTASEISSFVDEYPDYLKFDVTLRPVCSMSNAGFCLFAIAASGMAIAAELYLLAKGVSIVGLFLLADVLLLCISGLICRRNMDRSERIVIDQGILCVSRHSRGRLISQKRLRVFGLALECDEDSDYGCLGLFLVQRGKKLAIAVDVSPDERKQFAALIERALCDAGGLSHMRQVTRPSLLGLPSLAGS